MGCLVGHIFRPAPHTGLTYKRSRKSPWSAWFWCISPKSSWLPRVLSVSVCGPISGCPPDLTSPPPLIHPLAAADGHAGGAFDSALGGRNDGQARSMGPQTDVRSRSGRYLWVGSVPRSHFGQRIGAPVNELKSGWAGDDHGAVGAKFGRAEALVLMEQPGMLLFFSQLDAASTLRGYRLLSGRLDCSPAPSGFRRCFPDGSPGRSAATCCRCVRFSR